MSYVGIRRGWFVVLLITASLVTVPALAATKTPDRMKRARKLEDRALPLSAAKEYVRAWKETRVPEYLFYAARALEAAGEPAAAVRFYRKYLAADPTALNRREVLERVGRLEVLARASEPALAPETPAIGPRVSRVRLFDVAETVDPFEPIWGYPAPAAPRAPRAKPRPATSRPAAPITLPETYLVPR